MSIQQTTLSTRALSEMILLGLIWGGSFLSIRVALDEVPVLTVVLHRVGWAALALWVVVWARGLAVPRGWRVWSAFLVMGALNNVIPFGLMTWGQLYIETGLTSILNATTAIFGVLVSALIFADERLTRRRALGVGLGFLGVVAAIGPGALAGFDPRSLAQLAVVGGALSYACAAAWAKRRLAGLSPQVAAAGMLTGSTALMLPVTLAVDGVPSLALAPVTWAAIAYYALIATAGAYLLYYRVLAMAGAAYLMVVTLIIPPVAIVLGALVLGEALPANAFLGLALLTAGLWTLRGRPAKPD